jgi:hypothetical protein
MLPPRHASTPRALARSPPKEAGVPLKCAVATAADLPDSAAISLRDCCVSAGLKFAHASIRRDGWGRTAWNSPSRRTCRHYRSLEQLRCVSQFAESDIVHAIFNTRSDQIVITAASQRLSGAPHRVATLNRDPSVGRRSILRLSICIELALCSR